MKKFYLMIAALVVITACKAGNEYVVGNLEIFDDFQSKFVESRTVRVWTPSDYDASQKYDVIYMHDGQNLFDASLTWNNQEWGVDEVLTELMDKDEIRPCIVVGVDNSPKRYDEYYPSAICPDVPVGVLPEGFTPLGDEYLKFLVEEVKPWVDSKYSTWGDAAHTFVMGSSCGGLISTYAFCEYPEIFGGAGCLSTHSSLMNPHVMEISQKPASELYIEYLKKHLPADSEHKLYMDRGDCMIDSAYSESQAAINEFISTWDWSHKNYMYRFFPGHSHSESDWRSRLEIPVKFLLGKN